ncbi:MAG: type II toxin-antitoxin system prevent-host-death family antitoxin [Candidatus Limnocylindria bacterium]
MTIDRPLREIGVREFRDKLRSIADEVRQGEPYVVLSNNVRLAVLLSKDEFDRWERIERGLSTLHGLEIYPELARDTSQLAALVRGQSRPTDHELGMLIRQKRDILAAYRPMGIADARVKMAETLDQVRRSRPLMLVTYGKSVAIMVRPEEHRRLMHLRRIVAWFRAAGLDLATAEDDEVIAWARAFREQPSVAKTDEGSAIA